MTYAIHSLHAPPVLWHNNSYTLDGRMPILAKEPLFVADSLEEVERWREDAIGRVRAAP